ncbi:OsmC family protein [Liquorilactobacillus sicerae]|uniref:OsmC family protein n=1 Tax=Liquorilactobacillus sicerae TaxID=1416943 RepID=UPI0024804D29|nr:OsmC family protein [Liquorilactobacillus sicerae]
MAYEVKSILKQIGYQVRSQTGEYTLLADEPVRAGGTAAAPNPVQYLLMALNSCLAITAESIAKNHPEIKLEKFEIITTGKVKRFADKTSKVAAINVHFYLRTALDPKKERTFINSVIKYCTVHSSLDPEILFDFKIENI